MVSDKIKFKQQLKKEGCKAVLGYGNGYTIEEDKKNVAFVPNSEISHALHESEITNTKLCKFIKEKFKF